MDRFLETWRWALGLGWDPKDLTIVQTTLRGAVVFVAALVMVRLADRRFLSRKTPFDVILGFVLASMLARAINGSGPLGPTLFAGFALVGLHRLIARLAFRSQGISRLVKGRSDLVIENGRVNPDAMRRVVLSWGDLEEDLRMRGVERPAEVQQAWFERNGELSVIRRPD